MTNIKDEIIAKIYNDLSGFGSIKQTFDEARKKDKTLTLNDIVRKQISRDIIHMWQMNQEKNIK